MCHFKIQHKIFCKQASTACNSDFSKYLFFILFCSYFYPVEEKFCSDMNHVLPSQCHSESSELSSIYQSNSNKRVDDTADWPGATVPKARVGKMKRKDREMQQVWLFYLG